MVTSDTPQDADDGPVARTARTFDAVAASYDTSGVAFFGPIAAALLDGLAIVPGESLLDVGCGKGAVLERAVTTLGPGSRLVGVDVSAAMLREARQVLDARGGKSVELLRMDGQDLEFAPASFDVIASSLTLFFMPAPGRALESWRRTLTPGGRVGVTTFGPRDEVWRSVDAVFEPFLPKELHDPLTTGTRGPFTDDDSIAALFGAAGYADVQVSHVDLPVVFDDIDQWRAFSMSTGQRAMWEAVPATAMTGVVQSLAGQLARAVGRDGRIRLHQDVRVTIARPDQR